MLCWNVAIPSGNTCSKSFAPFATPVAFSFTRPPLVILRLMYTVVLLHHECVTTAIRVIMIAIFKVYYKTIPWQNCHLAKKADTSFASKILYRYQTESMLIEKTWISWTRYENKE